MAVAPRSTGRRRFLQGFLGLGIGTVTGTAAWGYFYERYRLELTRADVPVANLPSALEGLRIALLTDFHRSDSVPEDLVRQAVDLARREAPDLVILGGDYVTWGDRHFVEPAADALAGLTAPLGVFAVLGNHDDDRDMPAALARRGFTVLRDARTSIYVRGERVDLLGVRFWTRKLAEVERVFRGTTGFPILLAHDPRRLTEAQALGIPLVLSGHTHGGQVVLPGIGAIASRKFPIPEGIKYQAPTTLFVSRGIGTVYVPLRVNCPPEVALVRLVPQPA